MATSIAGVKYDINGPRIDYSNYRSGVIDFANAEILNFDGGGNADTSPVLLNGGGGPLTVNLSNYTSINYHLSDFTVLNVINGVEGRWYSIYIQSNGIYSFSDRFVFPNGDAKPSVSASGTVDLYNIYKLGSKYLTTFAFNFSNANEPIFLAPIYFTDPDTNLIYKFDNAQDTSPEVYSGELSIGSVGGIATDSNYIYVADTTSGDIYRFNDLSGTNRTNFKPLFNTSVVKEQDDYGLYTDIVYNSNNNELYVSYYDQTSGNLHVSKSNDEGNSFSETTIETTSGNTGLYSEIDVDAENNVYVVYNEGISGDLKIAKSIDSGSTFINSFIDTENYTGLYPSISATESGRISVSYYNQTNADLKYAESRDYASSFINQKVDESGVVGSFSSIGTNSNGDNVYISYSDTTSGNLKLAKSFNNYADYTTYVFGESQSYTVNSYEDVIYGIAGQSGSGLFIYRSRNFGNTYDKFTIEETSGTVGEDAAIAINDSNIYVSYYELTDNTTSLTQDLRFAKSTNSGETFSAITVDSTNQVGRSSSIDFVDKGANDNIYISYYDFSSGDLKFARSTDTGGSFSAVYLDNTLVAAGSEITSTKAKENNVYVVYSTLTSSGLIFAKSTDNGLTFLKKSIATDIAGSQFSMDLDKQNDILYVSYHNDSSELNVLKSIDSGETFNNSFAVPITIDPGDEVSISVSDNNVFIYTGNEIYESYDYGENFYLANIINGQTITNKSISLSDNYVSYVNNNDDTINTRKIERERLFDISVVDNSSIVGDHSSILVEEPNVYISYQDGLNNDLKFAKSTDSGSSWDIKTIDSYSDVGKYTSISRYNSDLYISYYDETNGDFKLAKSIDDGNFFTISIIDQTNDVGKYSSIASGNNLYVSYYDGTSGNLNFGKSSNLDINPFAMEISNDKIYITDVQSGLVYKFDTFAGNSYEAYDGSNGTTFSYPTDVTLDSEGRVYIVDSGNALIYRFDDMNGTNHIEYDGSSGTAFVGPVSVGINRTDGLIYISDNSNNLLYKITDMDGSDHEEYDGGSVPFENITYIDVDNTEDQVYIADRSGRIYAMEDIYGTNQTILYVSGTIPAVPYSISTI